MKKTRGYEILKDITARTFTNDFTRKDSRGRPLLLGDEDIHKLEGWLDEDIQNGGDTQWLPPEAIAYELGFDINQKRTIQKAIANHTEYSKCIACRKPWMDPSFKPRRVEFARKTLELRPTKEDYRDIRYSDEVHNRFGPQGRAYVYRKPGQRTCINCIQRAQAPKKKDEKRIHAWGAAGYDFKSEMVFYDVPSNTNGKMTQQVYRDVILEPMVKPWLEAGQSFVLEEDGDSGHGPKGNNIVKQWKEANRLKYFFNVPHSPDLSPIENCWQPPKAFTRKIPHWDDQTTRDLMQEGWDKLSQAWINARVDTMPQRLKDCLEAEGDMTGY